jgi:hypothetical protein
MDDQLERYVFIPVEKAIVPPPGLIEHIKDHWWLVHPEKGVAFYDKRAMAPQCNSNRFIVERVLASSPWAEVRFIPSVFRRIDPQDYV